MVLTSTTEQISLLQSVESVLALVAAAASGVRLARALASLGVARPEPAQRAGQVALAVWKDKRGP